MREYTHTHTHTHTHTSNFKRRVVIVCVIFILCIIAVVCTLKINKIDILKNIREKNRQVAENIGVTTVDVTNMVTGSNINHQHIYKTMYDSTQHWEECMICHEKNNVVNHNITTTWALRI